MAQKRPQPAPLLDGQVAVNINASEPGLLFKQTDGSLTKVGPACVNTTGLAPNSAPSGPAGNSVGELWLDGRSAFANPLMKVWNGTQWLSTSGFEIDDVTGAFSLGESLYFKQDVFPHTDSTINLGSPTLRFANIYTGDLHLRNERGDWTMIEEEDYLSLRDNKTGKTFRLVMEEVSG